jgi:hypothetical protein
VPSEQITVVCESDGTITVVLLFCGAGGLLLLMHPDNAASTTSEASIVFMLNPLPSLNRFNLRDQHAAIGAALDSSLPGTRRR